MALTKSQVEQFEAEGFVIVREAIRPALATEIEARLDEIRLRRFPELMAADDTLARVAPMGSAPYAGLTTDWLRSCLDQVLGANQYVLPERHGAFVCALPDQPRRDLGASCFGAWHVDGWEPLFELAPAHRGVVPIFLLSECAPDGGGTKLIRGSHKDMARLLAAYAPVRYLAMASFCDGYASTRGDRLVDFSGRPGDVALLHSLCIHSSAPNHSTRRRWICNTGVRRKSSVTLDGILSSTLPVDRSIAAEVRFAHKVSALRRTMANTMVELSGGVRRLVGGTRELPFSQEPKVQGLRRRLYLTISDACGSLADEMVAPLDPTGLRRWPIFPT